MTCKRFFLELLLALAAYAAAVLLSGQFLAGLEAGAGRVLLALLPVPPMIAMALVVIRQLRRLDEMGRRIHLEALALAFVCTALLTFAYGFLETIGFPKLSMFFVWPLMGATWAIGCVLALRRYA
ncbi:hypothetical protein ABZR71_25480 [Pseudomonas paraeruginosa]|uniref:hypothetical protein n=1 Tax=Pseudomonas aeruginosa group TaxID=136841 RepID=UPI0006B2655D|nr:MULTISPECIES: hypothetical protein [Pseudomonas aeruginosa group]KPD27228.1 hypothetical protein AN920_21040 [Pseudomonas paraeruginosa]KQB32468.1 hypothetical protein AOA77_13020 [Pseudomonas paraeruginosa]KSF80913.1 hypothetical protein AO940_07720 [Pseudomonas aeruginosa]MDT1024960.1 hypothetical protein [Pseudomonas paraeruginosa]PHJ29241.1 hypothetical protein CDG78_26670 [Pseudomonas paraeruginosa]